jgi:hypothetical protein
MPRLKPFDTSAFFDDDEVIAECLTAALEDSNPDVFLTAIGQVAKQGAHARCEAPIRHGAEGASEPRRESIGYCGLTTASGARVNDSLPGSSVNAGGAHAGRWAA